VLDVAVNPDVSSIQQRSSLVCWAAGRADDGVLALIASLATSPDAVRHGQVDADGGDAAERSGHR
jgi:hypothetical protein